MWRLLYFGQVGYHGWIASFELTSSCESEKAFSCKTQYALQISIPASKGSYSASLLDVLNANFNAWSYECPSDDTMFSPVPLPAMVADPSTYNIDALLMISWGSSATEHSTMMSFKLWLLFTVRMWCHRRPSVVVYLFPQAALTAWSKTARYASNGPPVAGLTIWENLPQCSLRFWNACSTSSSQLTHAFFFRTLKKGRHL